MPQPQVSFEEAIGYLDTLGVSYTQDHDYGKRGTKERHCFEVRVLNSLLLPLTPKEWCAACMYEGRAYIGGCCSATSAAQDILNRVFREGGRIEGKELDEIGQILANHDDIQGSMFNFSGLSKPLGESVQFAKENWKKLTPWEKISLLWHITRDHFAPEVPRAPRDVPPDLDSAIFTLSSGLRYLAYEKFFTNDKAPEEYDSQEKTGRILTLAKILPALRTVHTQIDTLDLGPFEGFALIDKERGPNAVAENGQGLCLYQTQEEVDHILDLWRRQEKEYEERAERVAPIDERIGVRRVRVSKEKGLEFLDQDEEART